MPRSTKATWKPEEIEKLIALSKVGATVARAAAALGRPREVVHTKARKLGFPLVGIAEQRRRMRQFP